MLYLLKCTENTCFASSWIQKWLANLHSLSDTECDNITIGRATPFPIPYLGLVYLWYHVNPLTIRTAIWRFGLITNRSIDRTIVLNFPYASYCPMRLS